MEEVKKRWIRCLLWQQMCGALLWLCTSATLASLSSSSLSPFIKGSTGAGTGTGTGRGTRGRAAWGFLRLTLFGACEAMVMAAHWIIISPEEKRGASLFELVMSAFRTGEYKLRLRVKTTGDWILFIAVCTVSAFLLTFSLVSSLHLSLRGAVLGLCYTLHYVYNGRWILRFPVIQRPPFFGFKIGIPSAAKKALMFSLIITPVSEAVVLFLLGNRYGEGKMKFLSNQILFFLESFLVLFCWELTHHIIQVVHTRRCIFAPSQGSAAAATNPTDILLTALEESAPRSLLQHLAYLDLCMASEHQVDSWRRAAFFEETGETYKRIIYACLRPLEEMVISLREGLEGTPTDKLADITSLQLQDPNERPLFVNSKDLFKDSQLCIWCARTLASLTAKSHDEDRFGVAQLSGCNGAVLSALLSCLLIVEIYLGKRSNVQPVHKLVGPSAIRWNNIAGQQADAVKKRVSLKKKVALYSKAFVMGDVLRTSIYEIISTFHDEMLSTGGSSMNAVVSFAERDWLDKDKLFYGNLEMLAQKLCSFLEFRA